MDSAKPIHILVVDDDPVIHRVFVATFDRAGQTAVAAGAKPLRFEVESAQQGEDAVQIVIEKTAQGSVFDVAFVDMQMPPGIGGIETIKKLWAIDPLLPVVICTASSGISGSELITKLGVSDRLFILKKPFDGIEIQQLALSISTRRELEAVAHNRMEELDQRVKDRTADLFAAKEQADAARQEAEVAREEAVVANSLKSQFLANMSHELRTPLNGVLGMLDLLLETSLTNRQIEYSRISQQSAHSLLAIINDILDYSKIECGQMVLESVPFDLSGMLEEIAALGAAQVAKKDVEVVLNYSSQLPIGVYGDPLRLRQVITNLLSNALKFTKDGHVVVEARSVAVDNLGNTKVRFAVRDTGIGIPPEKLQHIFRKFTQADGSTTREFGGTGLGLAISEHLVGLMGSAIQVTSDIGEGSEFSFEVLLAAAALPDPPAVYPELRDTRVLVVDDLQLNREILVAQLSAHTEYACAVDSAQSALEELRRAEPPYDIVLTDFQMPTTDGQQLGHNIRQASDIRQPKLILLSSNCSSVSQKGLAETGFDDYLIKPASRTILLNALQGTLLSSARSTESESDGPLTTSIRALVVDDNDINQLVAEQCLLNLGCASVEVCSDGKQAVDAVISGDFDIVFMDCQMPVMDGYTATGLIRQLPEPKCRIPIIALTANALAGDRDLSIAAGMDDHLPKPLQPQQVQRVLRQIDQLMNQQVH